MKVKIFLCIFMLVFLYIYVHANDNVRDDYELVALEDGTIVLEESPTKTKTEIVTMASDSQNSNDSNNLLQRSFIFYNEANIEFINKNYEKAMTLYTQSINLNPTVNAYYNRALAYSRIANNQSGDTKKKSYERAISDYTSAINLNPNDAHLYNNRAVIYVRLNLPSEAMLDFYKAKAIASDDADINSNINRLNETVNK